MAGRIPESFIDDLLNRIDIVEVIDARVPLKKKGKEYSACCPFHSEKTPSFTVSQNKQFYHCFGCKAHGTAVGFLMEYEHMSFPDAIEELARSQGLEVPYEGGQRPDPEAKKAQTDLYELMQKADLFYRQQLRQHPQSATAVAYLKQRGLSGEIAKDFGVGFAPDGWDNLLKALGTSAELEKALVISGMLIKKDDGKCYDRFRNRIMFPIRDRRGRTIAFGGRILPDSRQPGDKEAAKYLNSPETPLFHKGRELYGLYEARQALRDIPRLLVVEGYMDVVTLAQFDVRYAVATLGTATTPDHLQRLFQVTSEVVFCFDGDRAGMEAAWRALENSLPAIQDGREIRFMFLPEGEDPDSYIRKVGKNDFETAISVAQTFSDYFFQKLGQSADMTSIGGRAKLANAAKPLLEKMPEGIYRKMMFEQLNSLTRTEVTRQAPANPQHHQNRPRFQKKDTKAPLSPVRKAITLLLYMPELAQSWSTTDELTHLDLPGMDLLLEVLEILKVNPQLSTSALIERWRGSSSAEHLAKLAAWQPEFDDPEALKVEFKASMEALQTQGLELRYEALQAKSNQGKLSEDELSEFRNLLQKLHGAKNAQNH